MMTQAQYWHTFCKIQVPNMRTIVECQFARMMLSEAAIKTSEVGWTGRRWEFSDKSSIVSHAGLPETVR